MLMGLSAGVQLQSFIRLSTRLWGLHNTDNDSVVLAVRPHPESPQAFDCFASHSCVTLRGSHSQMLCCDVKASYYRASALEEHAVKVD